MIYENQFFDNERQFGMTNVMQEHTGLPFIIWIVPYTFSNKAIIVVQADYEVKLNRNSVFAITISDAPRIMGDTGILTESDLALLKEFILLNKVVLLDFWKERDINVINVLSRLCKVKSK